MVVDASTRPAQGRAGTQTPPVPRRRPGRWWCASRYATGVNRLHTGVKSFTGIAALVAVLLVPSTAAQAQLPVGEADGVRMVAQHGGVLVIFTARAEKAAPALRRQGAGDLVHPVRGGRRQRLRGGAARPQAPSQGLRRRPPARDRLLPPVAPGADGQAPPPPGRLRTPSCSCRCRSPSRARSTSTRRRRRRASSACW